MISTRFQITILCALALYFVVLLYLLVKRRLNLKYTLLWLAFGVLLLVFAVIPDLLTFCASLIGVKVASNGLFAVLHFCTLILLISMTAIVSKLNEKIKRLIQAIALLERRIRELEEEIVPSQRKDRQK